jgi:site-specific DNA-methyltransferase (adenine-specific)
MRIALLLGDCLRRISEMPSASVGAVVCDPPYGLIGETNGTNATGYLGIKWDRDTTHLSKAFWIEVHRVLVPRGVVKVFSATRTSHRLGALLEATGFEDISLEAWAYGGGFPKSLSIEKSVDAMVLTGKCNSRTLSKVEKQRPVVGTVRRVVSSGRRAAEGESRAGVRSNMERWLNPVAADIPVTAALTDKARAWTGWGTALKPAWEPVLVGHKPA